MRIPDDVPPDSGAHLAGRRILVLGAGVAGTSAAQACERIGATAVVVDPTKPADAASLAALEAAGVALDSFDAVMASPGFAPHSPEVLACQEAGLPVWSEMEFAWRVRATDAPWVLVTGTNGKTTTTQMVGALAAAAGLDVKVCGNMGIPVITAAAEPHDVFAVEIASLQLHFTHTLAPAAAVCLNADEDHLDWHGSVEAYRADKARVYERVRLACVYPAHDRVVEAMVEDADVAEGCRAIGITAGAPTVSQLGVVEGLLVDRAFHDARYREAIELGHVDDLAHLVSGAVLPHLITNALSAAALVRALGVPPEAIARGLRAFSLDAHRTALVREVGDVTYIDDSKATNPHAAAAAFGGRAPRSVVWIAGGQAKGVDYGDFVAQVEPLLRAVVVIGVDQAPLATALAEHAADVPVKRIATGETVMRDAVAAARDFAQPGDTVLLSPAAASRDQFVDYAARGEAFAAEVQAL